MDKNKIVVTGGGVLGSQIAFQTAYCGFDVTIRLLSPILKKMIDGSKLGRSSGESFYTY